MIRRVDQELYAWDQTVLEDLEARISVQDKRLKKDSRKGFHENYDIPFMKPYEPGYTIPEV
jgi:hypothetical protein